MLRCGDGTLYTGATCDLAARLARHAAGKGARYTRARLPIRLVFSEAAAGRGAALSREAALKRLTRAEKLALVAGARRRRSEPAARTPDRPRRGACVAPRRGRSRPARA